jgi:hypothetical protein
MHPPDEPSHQARLRVPLGPRTHPCSVLLLAFVGLLVACSSAVPPESTPSPQATMAKIAVDEDGIYLLSHADLMAAGLDLGGANPELISLSNQGREVPLLVSGEGMELGIIFHGTAETSLYSRENVYWLDLGGDTQKRIVERVESSAACGEPVVSSLHTVRAEEDLFYAGMAPAGEDHWYWQRLSAPETTEIPVDVVDLAPGDGWLRLALLGYTSDEVSPDHHVRIHLNGCAVGEASWDGQERHAFESAVPFSCMQEGENTLGLEALGETGARVDIILVDWFEIDYQRHLMARHETLAFRGQGGSYAIGGFSDAPVWLFDVSDPLDTELIADAVVESARSGYALSFCDDQPSGHHYLAVSRAGLRRPVSLTSVTSTVDLRRPDNRADYIVITHESFLEAVEPLAEWRRDQGLAVQVISITEVYDQFSHGLVDPAAIRGLLRYAHTSWTKPAPQYLLLVGEASYDYTDNMEGSNKSLVPTHLVETSFSGQTVSDNWFVCLDDEDVLPDMAIGRLPVSTLKEANTVVEKIIGYEQDLPLGDWRQRIVLVADGKEASFAAQSDLLAEQSVPSSYEVSKVYAGSVEDPQSAVAKELAVGSLVVNYVGHGSIDLWSEDRLLSSEQVSSLGNDGRQPMMILMSCLLGFFGHPERQSMAEKLLLAEDGGAVVVFAPSSLTLSSDQGPLNRALLKVLLEEEAPPIGLAILEAKRSVAAETQGQRDVIETFTLLGDPALRLANAD